MATNGEHFTLWTITNCHSYLNQREVTCSQELFSCIILRRMQIDQLLDGKHDKDRSSINKMHYVVL